LLILEQVVKLKKYTKIIMILLLALVLVACGKKEEETNMGYETIIKTDDGEVTEGKIEGYHFKETEEVTERVKIQMENGDIILAVLSNSQTPITKANFQELVKEKFYDGIIFHRVIKDFMIQGGDPTGTGYSGSDKNIKGEFKLNGVQNDLSHVRGVLSMARAGGNPETAETMNSASSQFFIVTKDSTFLDGNYAAFGKVFAGMSAVDKIEASETNSNDKPLQEQKMKSIRFIEIIED